MATTIKTLLSTDTRENHFDNLNDNLRILAEGSGGSAGGLTNTELREAPVDMKPVMVYGGNLSMTTMLANAPESLPFQPCKQITIVNNHVDDILIEQDGELIPVMGRSYFTFFGLTNAVNLRVQTPTAGVKVYARWET